MVGCDAVGGADVAGDGDGGGEYLKTSAGAEKSAYFLHYVAAAVVGRMTVGFSFVASLGFQRVVCYRVVHSAVGAALEGGYRKTTVHLPGHPSHCR